MSFDDIDMQSYAGEAQSPVAADHEVVDANSYQQQPNEDIAVHPELMEQESKPIDSPEVPANPQSEHFRALREEVGRLKADQDRTKREYEDQLSMLRANVAQHRSVEPPKPAKMFEGMDDTDVPTVAEIRNEWQRRESDYQARIEELQVQQMHPDYAEVMEKYARPLVQNNPDFIKAIQGADNKALFAYKLAHLAKQAQEFQQQQQQSVVPQINASAQRIVDNSKKPGTLSQAGGQGALSKADYYASMSDQEFARLATKHLSEV
jgi:hypothetical protein